VRVRVARSGRKHRIGNARILAAMVDAGDPIVDPDSDQLVFIGRDDRGVELYVIAVPDDRDPLGLTVIHCMPNTWHERG
jgi:hypothetical protein